MSNQSSVESLESDAGSGRIANAEVAGLAAALRSRTLEKLIHEPHWHNPDGPDFHERTAVLQYRYPVADSDSESSESESSAGESSESEESNTSSMAVSVQASGSVAFGSSTASEYGSSSRAPSLISDSTAKSSPAARTSRVNSIVPQFVLEEDETGVLGVPSGLDVTGRLACSFRFLNCPYRSDNLEEWDVHSRSHLRGHLPKEVHCPFRCTWTRTAESGVEAWRQRIIHIVGSHAGEEVDVDSRPARSLIEHLWRQRLIDDAQKKELVQHGTLARNTFHTTTSGARERRGERRARH